MFKMKGTKRSLLMSALALLLCVSMLIGSTFAWFTDSVTSAGNIIKSGTLDISMKWADGKESPATASWKNAADGAIFNYDKWEPGYTEARHIAVKNEGTLALKYQLTIVPTGEVSKLADVIDVYYIKTATQLDDRADLSAYKPVGTLAQLINNEIAAVDVMPNGKLAADEGFVATLVLKMREDAGNEYQGLSIGSEFAIQLLATQLTKENDSYGPDYDEDAALGTYIELAAGADLLAAMASAQADMPLTIKLNGDVKWPTEGHHGENDITPASSILIDGNGYTITATGAGVTPLGDNNAPMTLKNVKIVDKSVSYKEDAWEFTYLEMGGSSLTCYKVTFADEIQIGTNATFTNCSFESNEESVYAVWVEDGSAAFTNCTFTGHRGLKAHEAYGSEISAVIVKDCVFSNLSKKPGMAIGTLNADTTVSITGSTFINCQAGDQDKYIYETDTDVANFNFKVEKNTVLNGNKVAEGLYYDAGKKTFTVASKAGLMKLNGELAKVSPNEANIQTVNLTCDVDLASETWEPLTAMWVNFNGNGHTISNLTAGFDRAGRRSGFWGYAGAVSINDLTLHNVSVAGSQVGAFAGSAEGLRMNNCVLSGTNTITYVDGVENWNGVGAITGTLVTSTINATIAEGATVQLIKAGFVTDSGCKFQDNLTGYIQANAGTVTNNGTVQVVNWVITNADELVAAFTNLKKNDLIVIMNDIDMSGKSLPTVTGNKGFTMIGNGNTISNLVSAESALFVSHSGSSSYTFDGVVLENCAVNSTTNHGALFVADGDTSDAITIKNCHVKNCTVKSNKYAAAFVAYTAGYNVVNNGPVYSDVLIEGCSVVGGSITGGGSVGAAIAHAGGNDDTTSTVKNFKVDGVAINGEDAAHTGIVVGTANVGDTIISAVVHSGVTGNYNTATVLYGRFVPGTTGTLVIDGAAVN